MFAEFSNILQAAQHHLAESPRSLRTRVSADDIHEWNGCVEARALSFLAQYSVNEWWFWNVVRHAASHTIGPRIQLAHVVEAISHLRRLNEKHLHGGSFDELSPKELAAAVACGAVVLDGEADDPDSLRLVGNPLFDADFDPVVAAVHFSGHRAA